MQPKKLFEVNVREYRFTVDPRDGHVGMWINVGSYAEHTPVMEQFVNLIHELMILETRTRSGRATEAERAQYWEVKEAIREMADYEIFGRRERGTYELPDYTNIFAKLRYV